MLTHDLLKVPAIYDWFQNVVGGVRSRSFFVREHIKPKPGDRVLDIGCGTGDMLRFFPNTEYHGFDPSSSYIKKAQSRGVPNTHFQCGVLTADVCKFDHEFDIVHSTGVLHHINDEQCVELFKVASQSLKPGAKLYTLDGCFYPEQSFVEKVTLQLDRGRFMRNEQHYVQLARSVFGSVKSFVYPRLFSPLPYSAVIMEMGHELDSCNA